jgi:predicted nucleotide-binding protein
MAKIEPDKMQELLNANNVGFTVKDIPHGRQFRLDDGGILNVFGSGKIVWQGKDTPSCARIKQLLGDSIERDPVQEKGQPVSSPSTNKVFIVYGHDVEAREQLELLLRRMKLEPVILQNLPIGGQTIIEKLETNLDVRYACVLLTPDDEGYPAGSPKDKLPRARQNVVLELGMFLVRLGRKRVAILHKGNLELPSDINGLIYIKFNKRVDEVKERLANALVDEMTVWSLRPGSLIVNFELPPQDSDAFRVKFIRVLALDHGQPKNPPVPVGAAWRASFSRSSRISNQI